MSAGTTVRIPTSRLRPAVEGAIEAWRRERWAQVDVAAREEMAIAEPRGWWARRFGKRPAATREEAIERLKKAPDEHRRSPWDRIWRDDYERTFGRLSALKDACDLGLDAVDVAVDDVAPFKAHFTHDTAGYR